MVIHRLLPICLVLVSIPVALADLAEEIGRRGPGYLMTSSGDQRPHVMNLRFEVDGVELRAEVGRTAARNIDTRPEVTLLWAPIDEGGYSLIVNGVGHLEGDDAVVVAQDAVLHRPA